MYEAAESSDDQTPLIGEDRSRQQHETDSATTSKTYAISDRNAAQSSTVTCDAAAGGRWQQTLERVRQCASELVSTAVFVFLGTVSVATGNSLLIALVHGLTITLLIVSFSDIGGAHMNPVVTLAIALTSRSLHWFQSAVYILMQLIGGIVGASLTRGVLSYSRDISVHNVTVFESIRGGSHTLADGVAVGQGILLEVMMTFILILTILLVDSSKTWFQRLLPFAVGFAVFADIAVSANITGGSMNPARSFGPAVVVSDLNTAVWKHHYVYWIGPIVGSLIAVVVFRFIFGGAQRKPVTEDQGQTETDDNRPPSAV